MPILIFWIQFVKKVNKGLKFKEYMPIKEMSMYIQKG